MSTESAIANDRIVGTLESTVARGGPSVVSDDLIRTMPITHDNRYIRRVDFFYRASARQFTIWMQPYRFWGIRIPGE